MWADLLSCFLTWCLNDSSGVQTRPPSQAHRRCGTLKTTAPLVFDALTSRELPLDALLTFPINWNSYLQASTGNSIRDQTRSRPKPNPLQRVTQQHTNQSSFSTSFSSSAASTSSSTFSSLPLSSSSPKTCSKRDDGPPKAKKRFFTPLPEDPGCAQLLGSSEHDDSSSTMEESALGLLNLNLALEEREESSCPPTPALSDCDSSASTPRSATPTPYPSTPQVSFRTVDYKIKDEGVIGKFNQPLISPFSEELPKEHIEEEADLWREWERMCIESASS